MVVLFFALGDLVLWGEEVDVHPSHVERAYLSSTFGSPIRDDFLVNDDSTGFLTQYNRMVDVDSSGYTYILMEDARAGLYSLFLYILDPSGSVSAGPVKIGTNTDDAGIAVSPDGKALVAWEDGELVWIAMYDRSGNELVSPTVIDSGITAYELDVAANENGEYAVAFDTDGNENPKVWRIDSNGNPVSSFLYAGVESDHVRVSMDNSGNIVLVWDYYNSASTSDDVYFCLIDNTNTLVTEGDVSSVLTNTQTYPDVWMDPQTGEFWIVWLDARTSYYDVYMRYFDASGTPTASEEIVNDGASGTVCALWPHVSIDGASGWGFAVCWIDDRNGEYDVYAQRFDAGGAPIGGNLKVNSDIGYSQRSAFVGTGSNGHHAFAWEDERNAGTALLYARLFQPDGTSPNPEFAVDKNEGSLLQMCASCGIERNGGIIAWMDTRYSSWGDIFAQFIDTLGNLIGNNILVADDTTGEAYNPDVAVGGGSAIIVWVDNRNGSYLLYGQRYGLDGTPYGSNFQISKADLDAPIYGVSADRDGNFAVVWMRHDNNIMLRRYNNAGIPLTDTIVVNDVRDNAGYPDVAMDPDGNFVVVWNDWNADGTYDVYMQLFDSTGSRIGSNVTVIDRTGDVYLPRVARSRAGFVVVWADWVEGCWKIYAQIYQNNGNPIGTPFPVSSDSIPSWILWNNIFYYYYTLGSIAGITMDSLGNFIVGWITAGDHGDPDFVIRGFYADGTPVGPEVIVNNEPSGDEEQWTLGNSAMSSCGDLLLLTWGDARRWKGLDIYAELNTFDLAGVKRVSREKIGRIFFQKYTTSFTLNHVSRVNVRVCDVSGRIVYRASSVMEPGTHTFTWTPKNKASGVYFIVIDTGEERKVEKAVYLR